MAQDQARWQAQMAQDQAQFEASMQADADKLDWQKELAQLERDDAALKEAKADKEDEYTRLAELIMSTGHPATDAELEAAGMSRERANSYLKYYNENKKTTGGTGGSGNGDLKIIDNTGTDGKYDIYIDGKSGQPVVVGGTATAEDIAGLNAQMAPMNTENKTVGVPDIGTPHTYSDAVKIAKEWGVPNSYASGIMTKSEWSRRKATGKSNDDWVTDYGTYEEYLSEKTLSLIYEYGKAE
jgi:hypothetical protein